MSKRPLTLKFRIPPYRAPRNEWRKLIHAAVREAQGRAGVCYKEGDRLQIDVLLYLDEGALGIHDPDNRLKDIMDALQGRVGGPKNRRELEPIIPNDNQIFKVCIEKAAPPPQSLGYGHVSIRRAKARAV